MALIGFQKFCLTSGLFVSFDAGHTSPVTKKEYRSKHFRSNLGLIEDTCCCVEATKTRKVDKNVSTVGVLR